jgi:NitT/TauT family transport system substrate-binding protein
MTFRRVCGGVFGIAAVALVLGMAGLVGPARAADNVSFRLDWKLTGYQLPFYWAQEKGYYTKENLNVEIKPGAGSGKTVNLIGGGHDDIGFADYMLMAAAAAKGMPVKGLMGVIQQGAWAVISYADSPIKTPQDLVGKSVAMTADHKALFDLLLSVNKIPEDKVSIKIVSPATRNTIFANGGVDGFVAITIGSPLDLVVRAKEGKGKPVSFMPFAKFGVAPMGQGVIATDQVIEQKADVLARFMRASVRGFNDVLKKENQEEAIQIALKLSGTPKTQEESIRLQLQEALSYFHTPNTQGKPFGWMSEEDWKTSVDILLKTKKIDAAFPASNLYTNKFIPK